MNDQQIEILIDVNHVKRVLKAVICPPEHCGSDHKVLGMHQHITHAAIEKWIDNIFSIGGEALKRASASSSMDNRNLLLEADINAAMATFYFDKTIPFVVQDTSGWEVINDNNLQNWN